MFALAHVLIRGPASRAWQHRRQILVEWPTAQLSLGVIPWIVSLWAHDPMRHWLWALGIALDLYVTFAVSARDLVEHQEARERHDDRTARRGFAGRPSLARSQTEHLGERLGLSSESRRTQASRLGTHRRNQGIQAIVRQIHDIEVLEAQRYPICVQRKCGEIECSE